MSVFLIIFMLSYVLTSIFIGMSSFTVSLIVFITSYVFTSILPSISSVTVLIVIFITSFVFVSFICSTFPSINSFTVSLIVFVGSFGPYCPCVAPVDEPGTLFLTVLVVFIFGNYLSPEFFVAIKFAKYLCMGIKR